MKPVLNPSATDEITIRTDYTATLVPTLGERSKLKMLSSAFVHNQYKTSYRIHYQSNTQGILIDRKKSCSDIESMVPKSAGLENINKCHDKTDVLQCEIAESHMQQYQSSMSTRSHPSMSVTCC